MTYSINVAKISSTPTNNTFTKGYTRSSMTYGSSFGAGITITSLYYNIFSSSTLSFESPPSNTSTSCVIYGYVYNELPGATNAINYRDKQWIYTAFCPIDSTLDLTANAGNINFLNPQYPNIMTNGFPLGSILTYGYSD
jgi:hypothetical protein